MKVAVGYSDSENIVGTFEMECIPNVGELIFDQIERKHLVVEKRVFGIKRRNRNKNKKTHR